MPKLNVTPAGRAVYPHISQADTHGEFADNKFKTGLRLESELNAKELVKTIKAFAAENFPGAKNVGLPFKEQDDGTIIFRFKSKRKPMVYDAKRNLMDPEPNVGGGSLIKVAYKLSPYNSKGNKGVTAYLDLVQVLELHQGADASVFEIEDGFEAPANEGEEAFGDEGGGEEAEVTTRKTKAPVDL